MENKEKQKQKREQEKSLKPKVKEEAYPENSVVIEVIDNFRSRRKKVLQTNQNWRSELDTYFYYNKIDKNLDLESNVEYIRQGYISVPEKRKVKRSRVDQIFRSSRALYKNVQQTWQINYSESLSDFQLIFVENNEKSYRESQQQIIRQIKTIRNFKNSTDRLFQRGQLILGVKRIKKVYRENKNRTKTQRQQRSIILNKRINTEAEKGFQKSEFDLIIFEKFPKSENTFLRREVFIDQFTKMYGMESEQKEKKGGEEQLVVNNKSEDIKNIVTNFDIQTKAKKEIKIVPEQKYRRFGYQRYLGVDGGKSKKDQKICISDFRTAYRKKKIQGEINCPVGVGIKRDILYKTKLSDFKVPKPFYDLTSKISQREKLQNKKREERRRKKLANIDKYKGKRENNTRG